MITAPPVSAEALNIYIIFVQMTDRAGWGKVKCYFCCKNLVSQSKITHLVTLHRTELQMMIHRKSLIAKKEMILTLVVFKVSGVLAIDHL